MFVFEIFEVFKGLLQTGHVSVVLEDKSENEVQMVGRLLDTGLEVVVLRDGNRVVQVLVQRRDGQALLTLNAALGFEDLTGMFFLP